MIKAKEFWSHLCGNLGYNFFSGIPCLGFKSLYDSMDSSVMYYLPAASERIAFAAAVGAASAGAKSAVLLHADNITSLTRELSKVKDMGLSILFIVCMDEKTNLPIRYTSFSGLSSLNKIDKVEGLRALVIKGEELK